MIEFLYTAGANEAKQRKDANDVGACIAAIDSRFVTARGKDNTQVDKRVAECIATNIE